LLVLAVTIPLVSAACGTVLAKAGCELGSPSSGESFSLSSGAANVGESEEGRVAETEVISS